MFGSSKNMKVSVVIVAKHAEETIRYCVESLLRQTVKPSEIIVVITTSSTSNIASTLSLI